MYNHYVTSAFLDKKKLTRWVLPTCFFALSVSTPSLAAENACGPAVLDADFNITIPCLTTADGQRYSVNWPYKPEINPFSGDPVLKWEWKLGDEVAASCAASDNCAFKYDDLGLIIIPEVTNGAQSFYSATLMLDTFEADKLNLWYFSHSTEDGRLPASAMPEMDKALAPSIQGACGSIPPLPTTDLDSDGDGLTDTQPPLPTTDLDTDGDGLTDTQPPLPTTGLDSDGDGLTDTQPPLPTTNLDSDGDGLTDTYEECIGTNKRQTDTDGDRYSDKDELTQGTALSMNPLVADLPLLTFDVQGNITISLLTEDSQTHNVVIASQATTIANTTGTQRTDTASLQVSLSTTVGNIASARGSLGFSLMAGRASTTETRLTVSQENTTALEKILQTGTIDGKTIVGGILSVGGTLRNDSNFRVAVSDASLTALSEDGSIIGVLKPNQSTFLLDPSSHNSQDLIFTTDLDTRLDTGMVLALVRNPRATHYSLGSSTMVDYEVANVATSVGANTVGFKIDFNDGGTTVYNLNPAISPTWDMSMDQVLTRLGILYQTDAEGKLTALCKGTRYATTCSTPSTWIANDTAGHAKWVIQSGGQFLEGEALSTPYTASAPMPFLLVYITDADGDKLDKRVEALYGSLDSKPDTDSDGLDDYQEIYGWSPIATTAGFPYDQANPPRIYSDPTKADSDSDGLTDIQERTKGTDPMRPDTDHDGLLDNQDANLHPDSDGDGLLDGEEVNQYKTDSTKSDTDGDGLSDGQEVKLGTDPTNPDTNGNGINDTDDPEPLQVKYIADVQLRADSSNRDIFSCGHDTELELRLGYTFIGCWDTKQTAYGTNASTGIGFMNMYVLYKSANFNTSVRALTDLALLSQDCSPSTTGGTTVGCWKAYDWVKPTESLTPVTGENKPAVLQATYATVSLSKDSRVRDIKFSVPSNDTANCVLEPGYQKVACWNNDDGQGVVPPMTINPSVSVVDSVSVGKYMFMQIKTQ